MEKKNRFGIDSSPKENHISLLKYSKGACGVDFLLNTAEISERESWFKKGKHKKKNPQVLK